MLFIVVNVYDIPLSQLLTPCVKSDRLAIVILEEACQKGMEACKHNLHDRVIWTKGTSQLTIQCMKLKILGIWKSIEKWGVTSLEKGYYDFFVFLFGRCVSC